RVYPGRGTGGVCSGAERAARGAPGSNEPAHDATQRGGAEVGTNAVMPTCEPIKTHSCMKGSTTEADHIERTARLADRHESGCSDTPAHTNRPPRRCWRAGHAHRCSTPFISRTSR